MAGRRSVATCAATSSAHFPSRRPIGPRRASRRSRSPPMATTPAPTRSPTSATFRSANESALLKQRLLLAGPGHAHLGVLQALAHKPLGEVDVTLVSPFPRQVYSGMLPGWIAGHYELEQCVVHLGGLAARAGVKLQLAHVARLDLAT